MLADIPISSSSCTADMQRVHLFGTRSRTNIYNSIPCHCQ